MFVQALAVDDGQHSMNDTSSKPGTEMLAGAIAKLYLQPIVNAQLRSKAELVLGIARVLRWHQCKQMANAEVHGGDTPATGTDKAASKQLPGAMASAVEWYDCVQLTDAEHEAGGAVAAAVMPLPQQDAVSKPLPGARAVTCVTESVVITPPQLQESTPGEGGVMTLSAVPADGSKQSDATRNGDVTDAVAGAVVLVPNVMAGRIGRRRVKLKRPGRTRLRCHRVTVAAARVPRDGGVTAMPPESEQPRSRSVPVPAMARAVPLRAS